MTVQDGLLTPGEVLNRIPDLTRDKLNYWLLKGYIKPIIITKGIRRYNFYSEDSFKRIEIASELIIGQGVKDSYAFNRIENEFDKKP